MDEVTLVDLDLGKCDPAPGSPRDDARLLPWRDSLEAALTAAHKNIRSPTEYETSPMIAGERGLCCWFVSRVLLRGSRLCCNCSRVCGFALRAVGMGSICAVLVLGSRER